MWGTDLWMAHDDHIAIELQHLHGVLNGFLIKVAGTGHFRIRKTSHLAAQPDHACLMGEAGAGAWLVEGGHQGLVFQEVGVLPVPGYWFKFFGNFKNTEKFIPFEILE